MKRKQYVVYENTLKEVFRIAEENKNPNTNQVELYRYNVKHEMDDRQRYLQNNHSWQSKVVMDLALYNTELETEVENVVFELLLNKSRENIEKKVLERIMDSKISASLQIIDKDNGLNRVDRFVEMEFSRNKNEDVEYIYDTKELEQKLQDVKLETTFGHSDGKEFVYMEYVIVSIYDYRLERMKEMIPKAVKKVIRNNLTYCLKKGVSIVPDEYLDKGRAGVEEWKEMKSSANKNNSMEKRMVKQLLHDKKDFAMDCVYTATRLIAGANKSWTIPALEVDGRYNKQRVKKLVSQLLKDKNDQGIMSMSNEEIMSLCKEYWKGILMDAYNVVDQMKVEGQ